MIRLIGQDDALLAALERPRVFRRRYGADVSRHVEVARDVVRQTLDLERRVGAVAPWNGYLAVEVATATVVGCGGFKGNPDGDAAVEIAYFTFPEYEGRGFGTATALALIEIAERAPDARSVVAHTLPEDNASTSILRNSGFEKLGEVVDPEDGPVWRWRRCLDRASR